MAYLRGEPKVWSVVRVPSVAEEDDRRLHRERRRLISERIQHVNRIKGLLAIHGIYDYEPPWAKSGLPGSMDTDQDGQLREAGHSGVCNKGCSPPCGTCSNRAGPRRDNHAF
jgi:hypothetical protein